MGNVMVIAFFLETAIIYANLEEGTKMDGWYRNTNQSFEALPHFLISSSGVFKVDPFPIWRLKTGYPEFEWAIFGYHQPAPFFSSPLSMGRVQEVWLPAAEVAGRIPEGLGASPKLSQMVTGTDRGTLREQVVWKEWISWWVELWAKMINDELWNAMDPKLENCVSCQAHTHTFRWKNRCNPQVQMFLGDKIICFLCSNYAVEGMQVKSAGVWKCPKFGYSIIIIVLTEIALLRNLSKSTVWE